MCSLVVALPRTASAEEPPPPAPVFLREGTIIAPDGAGDLLILEESRWLLRREDVQAIVVLDAEATELRRQLANCQKRAEGVEPKPGFLSTPSGKAFVVGGFTISVTAAFVGGAFFARNLVK